MITYDLIIIGMGPAGMSAAIYAKRNGLNVLILESVMPGGLVNNSSEVDNYLGFYNTSGPDLVEKFTSHIKSLDINYKIKEVSEIINLKDIKKIITKDEEFLCKFIIIATGRSPKLLGLPNELNLLGRGISRCALCDGMFFKDKDVAVIGGGNSALEETLHLANICKKIYLIHRRDSLRGENILQDRIKSKENIEILYNSEVTKINDENELLKSIEINHEKEINIQGMFVYIGYVPKIDFAKGLVETNEAGYIKVNGEYETSTKGIYAIGDIIDKDYYQIVTAVSEGAIAAINISKKI